MTLSDILKNDFVKITIGVLIVLTFLISFININWKNPSFKKNIIQYILIFFTSLAICSWLFLYLNEPNNIENKKIILDFLKTLLPTTLAILSLLYALSSGLFNIKKENLQFDINKFEKEKEVSFNELGVLNDSLSFAQEQLDNKKVEIIKKEKEIETYKSTVTEIKKENEEKSKEIQKYEELTLELEEKRKEYIRRSVENINDFLDERFRKSVGDFRVECVGLHDKEGILVSVLDSGKTQLSKVEFKLSTHQNETSGYPNHQPIPIKEVEFDVRSKKFLIPHTMRNLTGRILGGEINSQNLITMGHKSESQYKYPYWTFEVPFDNAEYIVYLNKK